MLDLYDVRRKTTTYTDGVDTNTWAVIETIKIDVQPIRFNAGRGSTIVEIELGGEKYVPSFRGFTELDMDVTATDRITSNSGTTLMLVLRTYDYEDHKEIDLREVKD